MKKVEKISELNIGQTIYVDEEGKKNPYVIRSLENKFVSYIVATDNSSHSIMKGIWIKS